MPSARPRSGHTGGGNVRGGFEGVVDPATRRALIDLRRNAGGGPGIKIVGTIPTPGPPAFPGTDPGDIWIDSDGNGWSWNGSSWVDIGPIAIQGPPGPPGPPGAGGSGFTFVQESVPTALQEGDTWWSSGLGALSGTSWLAVSEVPGSAGPLNWVQFAPGVSAPTLPPVAYTHNQGVAAATWVIVHNLGFYPNVTVIDSGLSTVEGDVTQIDPNTLRIQFSGAFSGVAYLS